jgi:hypothetical protein
VDSDETVFILLFSGIFSLVVFYFIIKAAVRNGVLEAQTILDRQRPTSPKQPAVEQGKSA